jgi:hypothetical protein
VDLEVRWKRGGIGIGEAVEFGQVSEAKVGWRLFGVGNVEGMGVVCELKV